MPQQPDQVRTMGFLLREVYGLLQQRVYNNVMTAGHPDLRAMHSPVLRHLPTSGGRVADLARATGLAKQSVTYIVEDLVELGYLRAVPDPEDARARRIVYTARGQKLYAALMDASLQAESELGSVLGTEGLRSLREMLETALRDLPRDNNPATKPRSKKIN